MSSWAAPLAAVRARIAEAGRAVLTGPSGSGWDEVVTELRREWPGPVVSYEPDGETTLGGLAPRVLGSEAPARSQAIIDALHGWVRRGALLVLHGRGLEQARGSAFDREVRNWLHGVGPETRPGGVVLLGGLLFAPWEEPTLLPPRLEPGQDDVADARPWLRRRPGLLPWARRIDPPPDDAADLGARLLVGLDALSMECLLLVSEAGEALGWDDIGEVLSLDLAEQGRVRAALRGLLGDGVDRTLEVPEELRDLWRAELAARLPGVLPRALLQRLAGTRLRTVAEARVGLRLAVRAGDGGMASAALLHAQTLRTHYEGGDWRALRDDAAAVLGLDLGAESRAEVAWLHAQAQERAGSPEDWHRALLDARTNAEEAQNPGLLGRIDGTLGRALLLAGALVPAEEALRRAAHAAQTAGDDEESRGFRFLAASAALRRGDRDGAGRALTELGRQCLAAGDLELLAHVRTAEAASMAEAGALRAADRALEEAEGIAAGPSGQADRRYNRALLATWRGDRGRAQQWVHGLAMQLHELPDRLGGRVLALRSSQRRAMGDARGSLDDAEDAVIRLGRAGDREGLAGAALSLAAAALAVGERERADDALGTATRAPPPDLDPAVAAGLSVAVASLRGWSAVLADPIRIGDLVQAAAVGAAAFARVPHEPVARRLAAGRDQVELSLLAAAVTRGVPFGTGRLIASLLDAAASDPEREGNPEPALHALDAIAHALCGRWDLAHAAARRTLACAALDRESGARARVVLGEPPSDAFARGWAALLAHARR